MLAELNGLNGLDFCGIEEFLLEFLIPALIFIVEHVGILFLFQLCFFHQLHLPFDLGLVVDSNELLGDPPLESTVKALVVNIILITD